MARFSFGVGQWLGGGDKLHSCIMELAPFPLSKPEAFCLPSSLLSPNFLKGEPAEKQCNPAGVSFNSVNCPAEETLNYC